MEYIRSTNINASQVRDVSDYRIYLRYDSNKFDFQSLDSLDYDRFKKIQSEYFARIYY